MDVPRDTTGAPAKPRRRLLRWMIGLAVVLALLAAYALALRWVTARVNDDVQKSIRELPVSDEAAQHR